MNQKQTNKLYYIIFCLICFAIASSFIIYALRNNIDLYYTPSEAYQNLNHIKNKTIRLGGMVVKNSIKYSDNTKKSFIITDFSKDITVNYSGILPDLFKEGQGIVVKGRLENNILQAQEVLAKHDENYMPPNIKNKKT